MREQKNLGEFGKWGAFSRNWEQFLPRWIGRKSCPPGPRDRGLHKLSVGTWMGRRIRKNASSWLLLASWQSISLRNQRTDCVHFFFFFSRTNSAPCLLEFPLCLDSWLTSVCTWHFRFIFRLKRIRKFIIEMSTLCLCWANGSFPRFSTIWRIK